MEGGDLGETTPPLSSHEAVLQTVREVARTVIHTNLEAALHAIMDLHQVAGLETDSKRPSLVIEAAEELTAAEVNQPGGEEASPPASTREPPTRFNESGVSDGDEAGTVPLAGAEQSDARDSPRHSSISIEAFAQALVSSALNSGLTIALAKQAEYQEAPAAQNLSGSGDTYSVDLRKNCDVGRATAAGHLDNLSTYENVLSVVSAEYGQVDIPTLAGRLVESIFNAAMVTALPSMADEWQTQSEATDHVEDVVASMDGPVKGTNGADCPRYSVSRPGAAAELGGRGQAGEGRRPSGPPQPSVGVNARQSEPEWREGGEEVVVRSVSSSQAARGEGRYEPQPLQQEDTWAAEGEGKRASMVAQEGMGEEEGPHHALAKEGEKVQAGQRRSRASSAAGQVVEGKGGKKGKGKKAVRHEPLRVRRIREQRKRPRAPRLPTPYVPPHVPIALTHPGHESGRVLRLRTMLRRFKRLRRRRRRAARWLQEVSTNSSMSAESLDAAWPLQPSLLARYLSHALALARSPGLEPLLHDSVLTYAGALGPRYDPLLPLALVDCLLAQDARRREVMMMQRAEVEPHVPLSSGEGEGMGEEERGRGQQGESDREDRDVGSAQEEQDTEVGMNERDQEMQAPWPSMQGNEAQEPRRQGRKRSLPPAPVVLDGPAADALDAYVTLAVGAAATDPRNPHASLPLLKETASLVLLPFDPLAMLLSLCPPPHGHATCRCPALSLATAHLPPFLDHGDTGSLHTLVVAYFSTRLRRWCSLLTSSFFLALGQDATLLPALTRLSAFLTDQDRRALASCGRGGRVLGGACSRLFEAAIRVQMLARRRQATALVSQKRGERLAAIRIQASVRGHLHGRRKMYRKALRQRRLECMGLDGDLMEALTCPRRRRVLSPHARLELTRAVGLKLRALTSAALDPEAEEEAVIFTGQNLNGGEGEGGQEEGVRRADPAAARALVGLDFLQDLVDQLKDHRQLPAEVTAELLGGLTALLPGIPPTAPSPLLSRAFVLHAVCSLLHPSSPPVCLRAACRFLSRLTPQRCVAFPNAFLETPLRASLLHLLSLPSPSLSSQLLSPSFPSPPLTHTLKTWRSAALALLPLYSHTSRALPCPLDPLPSLLSSCSTLLLLLDLCLTSPAMARRHPRPQLRHATCLCLSALSPLARLLLSLVSPPHSLYTFQNNARDADLVHLLKRLLALRHRTFLHAAAIHVATLLCDDVRVRRLLVRAAFSDALALVVEEQEKGQVREAAEHLLKILTATVLDDMDEEGEGEEEWSEEEGEWRERDNGGKMSPRERRRVEATALRGLERVLVE